MAAAPVEDIVSLLTAQMDNLAVVISDGAVLFSNFEEDAVYPLVRYVQSLIPLLETGSFVRQDYFVALRLSSNVFICVVTNLLDAEIVPLFARIYDNYAEDFDILYPSPPTTIRDICQGVLFSMAKAEGPEPIAWVPESHTYGDVTEFAIKSLLELAGESGGAQHAVISLRPFLSENLLGLIYLFDIPADEARGHAYDSSITILVDYSTRAFIYEVTTKIELLCQQAADELISSWQDKDQCIQILSQLEESLGKFPLRVSTVSEDIKEEMLQSVRALRTF
ncbi:MAG TPA: hypothetical protein VKK79_18720 [Candidatus Lokiarchaeia archaeon]|nr:hypothetical protein [Candidatus Lokiarchaeia archaeon]